MGNQAGTLTLKIQVDDKGRPIVKDLNAQIKKLGLNVQATSKKSTSGFKGMWKQMAVGIGVTTLISKSFQLMTRSVTDLFNATTEFEKEFANVTTLIDDDKSIEKIRDDVLGLAGPLGDSIDLTKGLYQAISAGQKPGEAVRFVGKSAIFAKAALVEMKDSVDVLTTVINAYGLAASDVTDVSDVLFQVIKDGKTTGQELASSLGQVIPVANTLNVNLREVGGAMAIMTKSGISTRESVTALRATMISIIKPTEGALKAASKYGVELSKIGIEKAGGLQKWLADLKTKLGDNETAMASLFPNVRALTAVFTLTGSSAKEYAKQMVKMNDANIVAGNSARAFAKQQATFGAVMTSMKNKLEAIFIKTLLPALQDMAKWITENEESIKNFLTGAITSIVGFSKALFGVIKILFDFKELIVSIGVAMAVNFAINKISAIGTALVTTFTNAKISAIAFRTAALGVAGIITGVLLVAISKLNSHYNDMKKKIFESNEILGKQFTLFRQFPKLSKEISIAETKRYKDAKKELAMLNREMADRPAFFKLEKAFIEEWGENSNEAAEKIAGSTERLLNIRIKQDTQNKKTMSTMTRLFGITGKLNKTIKTGTDVLSAEEKAKKLLDGINKKTTKSLELQTVVIEDWTDTTSDAKEMAEADAKATEFLTDKIENLTAANIDNIGSVEIQISTMQKIADVFTSTGDKIKKFAGKLFELADGAFQLADAGLVSEKFAQTIEDISTGSQGVGEVATGLGRIASGDIIGGISELAKGVAKVWKSLKNLFGVDGVQMAIDRENKWMNLTEEQTKALKELEGQIGNTHAATSMYLDTLIEGQVTYANSDKWLERIKKTLSDVDRGFLSGSEAAKEMGESFSVWLEQAVELGTTGSKVFFDFVSDLKTRGIEVKEITDFINEGWDKAVDGWRKFKQETGSTISLPVLDDIIAKQDELAKDKYKPALNGISGLEEALLNMSNVTELSNKELDAFEAAAGETFKSLTDNGLDSKTALEQMAPVLSRLNFLSKEHNLILDDSTKKLIEDAKAQGINLDVQKSLGEQQLDLQQKQFELFEKIAVALGVNIEAMDDFGNAAVDNLSRATKGVKNLGNNIIDIGREWQGVGFGGNIGTDLSRPAEGPGFVTGGQFRVPDLPEFENDGFPIRVSAGEPVTIGKPGEAFPNSNNNNSNNSTNSGGGSQNIEINIINNSGDDIVDNMVFAFRNNIKSVNDEMEKALRENGALENVG